MFIKISETLFLWHLQIKVVLKMLNYSHIFVKHLRIYKEMHVFFKEILIFIKKQEFVAMSVVH